VGESERKGPTEICQTKDLWCAKENICVYISVLVLHSNPKYEDMWSLRRRMCRKFINYDWRQLYN